MPPMLELNPSSHVGAFLKSPDTEKRIFNALISSGSTLDIRDKCIYPTPQLSQEDLDKFLTDSLMQEKYLERLLGGGDPFRTAVALSPFTCYDLPKELQERFEISLAPGNSAEPQVYHPSWWLCSSSEMRMQEALVKSAFIKTGPGLMVKFDGRLTALCFRSFTGDNGTFIKDNFYSPDEEMQEELKEDFRQGNNKRNLARGKWFLMRGVRHDASIFPRLLKTVEKKASNMPLTIPDKLEAHTREEYLRHKRGHY